MAQAVQLWQDDRGFLHRTPQAADEASRTFEREKRRAVVHQMLVSRVHETLPEGARATIAPFHSTSDLADWLIANWPTLKAIGYAYRVDDLIAAGETSVAERAA